MYVPEFIGALSEHYKHQSTKNTDEIARQAGLNPSYVESVLQGEASEVDWTDLEALVGALDTTIGTVALHYDHAIPDSIFYGLVADETLRNVDVSELDREGRRFLLRHLRRGEPPHPTLRPLDAGQGNDFLTFFEAIDEPSEILLTKHTGADHTGIAVFDAFDNLRLSAFVPPALLQPYDILTCPDQAMTPEIYGATVSEAIFYIMKLGRFWNGEYRRLINHFARKAGSDNLQQLSDWIETINNTESVTIEDWNNDQRNPQPQ